MELKSSYIEKIIDIDNDVQRVRLYGEVSTISGGNNSEIYWFDFPAELEPFISRSGNPWLVCLLPQAMTLGEPLQLCLPVDSVLLENIQKRMWILKSW